MRQYSKYDSPCTDCPYRKNDFCTQFNKTLEAAPINRNSAIYINEYLPCHACLKELAIEEGE